jgi:hypothetical protein
MQATKQQTNHLSQWMYMVALEYRWLILSSYSLCSSYKYILELKHKKLKFWSHCSFSSINNQSGILVQYSSLFWHISPPTSRQVFLSVCLSVCLNKNCTENTFYMQLSCSTSHTVFWTIKVKGVNTPELLLSVFISECIYPTISSGLQNTFKDCLLFLIMKWSFL